MSKAKYPHVEKALRYAKDVVAGKILACKWTRLACGRHLHDLDRSKEAAYPYRFDPAEAERQCVFAELMPHVKGQWAARGERIVLQPHQCFRRSVKFGWREKETGKRRFRVSYEEIPRKNAKSTDAAIDGLALFAADKEFGAEVYSGATSEEQAWEVFRPARQMAERTPAFLEKYGVEVNAKSLTILTTGARFKPVIGKPGDGPSPSCAIVDEYHEHADASLYDAMETGMGAREHPLLDVITTAGTDIAGPCYGLRERACKMLDGAADDRLFAIIYTIDEGDDWTTEDALRKANPNFDVSVSGAFLREQQQAAINDASKQMIFKTKHLNVWGAARAPWMNMEWWGKCADAPAEAEFAGEPCAFASDLASRLDLCSVARMYRRDLEGVPHFYVYVRHYVPRAAVDDPTNRHYQKWSLEGHLTATEGNDTDYEVIAADISGKMDSGEPWTHDGDAQRGMFAGIWVDPWNHRALTDRLRTTGVIHEDTQLVEVPQQTIHLSPAMKDFEAAVKDRRIHHTGDPILTWAMSNVTVKPDAKENVFPRKDRKENKIDPAVAVVLAYKGAQFMTPADTGFFVESV